MNIAYDKKLLQHLFPLQDDMRIYYEGDEDEYLQRLYKKIVSTGGDSTHLTWDESDMHSQADMGSSCVQWQLLQSLILMSKAKRVLEIGTFIGLSAIAMAKVIGDDGCVTTIEKFDKFALIAKNNFIKNNVSQRINLICGDAFVELSKMKVGQFDFIYLDGNKENYAVFFEKLDPLLTSGGVLCVDDCFFNGDVLNDYPVTEKGQGVQKFLDKITLNSNYHKMLLPIGNGLVVMFKY